MHWRTDIPKFRSAIEPPGRVDDARYICFQGGRLVTGPAPGPWEPLTAYDLAALNLPSESEHYLGELRGEHCYAVALPDELPLPREYGLVGLRQILGRTDEEHFYLAGRAQQILDWDRHTRHCGSCGQPTRLQSDRSKICDQCRVPFYPRLSPSIIVLVTKGDQMLLARNAAWGPDGFYSTLAGFVEPGESIEETVHREVYEEVGIQIRDLRYLGSQSWPFPNSLMLGFHAEYDSGEFRYHDKEIADAQWFDIDALPRVPGRFAISRWLIDAFVEEVRARDGARGP